MHRTVLIICLALATAGAQDPRVMTFDEALRLAHRQGREKQQQDEEVRLLEATLTKVRGDYGPSPSASATARLDGTGQQQPTDTQSATVGMSQRLPGGGSLSVEGVTSHSATGGANDAVATTATVTARQPLLRGAGMLRWREDLTAAERALLYGRRAHELFRQDLTVGVARAYWDLQRFRFALEQARAAVERARFTAEQSRALMAVGKTTANDVFRAETGLLTARQSLIDAEAGFSNRLEDFAVRLNLPPDQPLAVDEAPPAGARLRVDARLAIATAIAGRLDLQTAADRVSDARRAVALSRRELLPDLDLAASANWGGARTPAWSDTFDGKPGWSASATLELPLDRRAEQLGYDRALVAQSRAARALDEARSRVVRDVLDAVRQLRSSEESLAIQERNRIEARRREEKAQLDFRAGSASNRDVLEAQTEVRQADNAWFAALVSWRTAEVTLRKEVGVLTVRDDGTWDDAAPVYATVEEKP